MIRCIQHELQEIDRHTGIPVISRTNKLLLTLLYHLNLKYVHYNILPEVVLLGIEYRVMRLGCSPTVSTSLSK